MMPTVVKSKRHKPRNECKMKDFSIIHLMVVLTSVFVPTNGFVVRPSSAGRQDLVQRTAVKVEGYNDAFQIIDECAVSGVPSKGLYDAVRVIDKNAFKIYPDDTHKQALWDDAHGSWKLQLATGGGKYTTFKPVPIFAFAMIDEEDFGNGVGWNQDKIVLSLLGPHYYNTKRRQMIITIDDMYLGASSVSKYVPGFIKEGMGMGKRPEDYKKPQRPPAFTMIGASDKALIARGGSGGIAIWTRLEKDIRPAAYG